MSETQDDPTAPSEGGSDGGSSIKTAEMANPKVLYVATAKDDFDRVNAEFSDKLQYADDVDAVNYAVAIEERQNGEANATRGYAIPDQPLNDFRQNLESLGVRMRNAYDNGMATGNNKWNDEYFAFITLGAHGSAGAASVFQTCMIALTYKHHNGTFDSKCFKIDAVDKEVPTGKEKADDANLTDNERALLKVCDVLRTPSSMMFWTVPTEEIENFLTRVHSNLKLYYGLNPLSKITQSHVGIFPNAMPLSNMRSMELSDQIGIYSIAQALQCVELAENDFLSYRLATNTDQYYVKRRIKDHKDVDGKPSITYRDEMFAIPGSLYKKVYRGHDYSHPRDFKDDLTHEDNGKVKLEFEYIEIDPTADFSAVRDSRISTYGSALAEYSSITPQPECGLIALLNQCHFFAKAGLNPFALLEMRLRTRGGASRRLLSAWVEKGNVLDVNDVVRALSDVNINGCC